MGAVFFLGFAVIGITLAVILISLFLKIFKNKSPANDLFHSRGCLFYAILYSANRSVEMYRSPVSGSRTTIFFPLFSGRFAS